MAVALTHARRLLERNPSLAAEQAGEILRAVPGNAEAELIQAMAAWRQGESDAARAALHKLVDAHPFWPEAQYQWGLSLVGSDDQGAERAFRRAIELKPGMSDAWRALGDLYYLRGDTIQADHAYAQQIRTSVNNPVLMEAASALVEGRLAIAERLLKDFLKHAPTDIAAIRMLAELAARLGRYGDAEALLRRCLELAPNFKAARHNYALVLYRQGSAETALPHLEMLLRDEPGDPNLRNLKAAVLSHLGDYDQTIAIYAAVLRDYPNQAKVWMSYGHALKTAGRTAEGIDAYRQAIALTPGLGEAYWSLANLKTFQFEESDLQAMEVQIARSDLDATDRLHFHFALGKALEDRARYAESFHHYAEGNRIRQAQLGYSADDTHRRVDELRELYSAEFIAARAGAGCESPDPIFIVGLPRSGSTLIEQILSSHSAVEGTMELPDLAAIAAKLGERRRRSDDSRFAATLVGLSREQLRELGEEYLRRTRIQRKTGRPFFIDKTPQNFFHVGLIHLILPNAKIIDARRHPLAAGFSSFRQHFALGHAFSYGLEDIGRYYRDYVDLMAHMDRALPGRVHRIVYESMVDDTEAEIRRLLDHCGLPFEDSCLRFHQTERAVRTASSEQVRRPIFREGLDHWQNFSQWLDPMRQALGDVLEAYPDIPKSLAGTDRETRAP